MNLEPAQPPPSRLTSCNLHPDEPVTGFCASCLRERLAGLDPATRRNTASSSSPTSLAASSLKAIFKVVVDTKNRTLASSSSASSSFLPELRRSKSFSGGKGERFAGAFEPQRKSCDVRVRNSPCSLLSLFHQDDGDKEIWGEIEVETRNLGFSGSIRQEVVEEEGEEEEIRASESVVVAEEEFKEIEEEIEPEVIVEEEAVPAEEIKTMKDHIDLDSQNRKPPVEKSASTRDLKEIAGSFFLAASVFSKKLQKWRRRQKMKKRGGGSSVASGSVMGREVDKRISSRRIRETQSEVADYGYGRRSCDTDPRFSLDAGRISFDDPRYSFDEPRASWDGYLIGGRASAFPRLPPMLSVVEDVPTPVRRSDNQILVEEPRISVSEDSMTPGGSIQTRDYYSDSSSSQRRRLSLERSNSTRKTAMVAETDETKSISNSKVSPANVEFFHGNKCVVGEKDLRDSNSNSLRDDCSESFESVYRDAASVVASGKGSKKSSRWSKAWNIWGLIHWRSGSKDDEDERYSRSNVVERSLSESWPELRREANGDAKAAFNRKVFRSNSCVSSRNSYSTGAFGSTRKTSTETNGHSKKRRDEFVLERNRSARYSPNHLDNGLLRFYLTPLRSSRRSGTHGKSRSKNSHSFARSVLRLY